MTDFDDWTIRNKENEWFSTEDHIRRAKVHITKDYVFLGFSPRGPGPIQNWDAVPDTVPGYVRVTIYEDPHPGDAIAYEDNLGILTGVEASINLGPWIDLHAEPAGGPEYIIEQLPTLTLSSNNKSGVIPEGSGDLWIMACIQGTAPSDLSVDGVSLAPPIIAEELGSSRFFYVWKGGDGVDGGNFLAESTNTNTVQYFVFRTTGLGDPVNYATAIENGANSNPAQVILAGAGVAIAVARRYENIAANAPLAGVDVGPDYSSGYLETTAGAVFDFTTTAGLNSKIAGAIMLPITGV